MDEVQQALKKIKDRETTGPEGFPNELLKYGGQHRTQQLIRLINDMLSYHTIPDERRKSAMILLSWV